jgi:hypothetical protein
VSDDPWNQNEKPSDELGSLAQSARHSSLKQARIILMVAGIWLIGNGLLMLSNLDNEVRDFQRENRGLILPEEVIRTARLMYYGLVGLGVVFLILAAAVPAAPLVTTVTGLVLYLGLNAVITVMDPVNLVRGLIIKIIIVIGLVKAVQAAAAYEREGKAERRGNRSRDSEFE